MAKSHILLCVLLAWIPTVFSARGCGGGGYKYSAEIYMCRPQFKDQMELMQKAFDANAMIVGRQQRRKRNVGPESLETQFNKWNESCGSTLHYYQQEGLLNITDFPLGVAHSIHSMTIDDLREYFDENALENNGIPTVDPDLTSNTYYHYNTLPSMYDKTLANSGLRTLDYVLSNMDNNKYDLLTLPENKLMTRLVHAFHMKEMWEMVKESYLELVKNPPTDKNVCSCVKDIENNMILANIKFIALWNRGLVEDANDENGIPLDTVGPIVNEATWKEEKNSVFGNHRDHFSPALFLYCMLNE